MYCKIKTFLQIFYGTLKKLNVTKSDGKHCIVNVEIPKGLPVNGEITHHFTDDSVISE